ncbi:MAG TPA: type 4a pilus biogenesis protein PilO [Methylomirabilota bacterium]|jgi:type IV pilus assembly protein PilO|nr:type 4a pilus biogenesis protein PilO [Methylomirabilota bacterium]
MTLPPLFDPIVNAPKWQKMVLGLAGVVVLVAAAYFLLISPIEVRISALRAQRESLQRELMESRRIVADIARFRREIAELEKNIEVIKEKLPNEKEMPTLYRTLSDAAYQAGLGVALFQPREPKVTEYFNEIPITLNAEGGYHQLGDFYERVAAFPRVVNVVDWRLTGLSKGRTSIKADLTLATYVYRPVGSPPAPKPPGARPVPARQ